MRNLVKYVGMGLLVLGLAACDQKKDEAANDNGVSASQSAQTVTLMDGKLSFSLPPGMSDKSGKLVRRPLTCTFMRMKPVPAPLL